MSGYYVKSSLSSPPPCRRSTDKNWGKLIQGKFFIGKIWKNKIIINRFTADFTDFQKRTGVLHSYSACMSWTHTLRTYMTITQFINGPWLVTQSLLFLPLTHTHALAYGESLEWWNYDWHTHSRERAKLFEKTTLVVSALMRGRLCNK